MTDVKNRGGSKGKKTAGGLLGIVLLLIYWFAQPVLNEKLGLNLPSLRGGGAQVATPSTASADAESGSPDASAAIEKNVSDSADLGLPLGSSDATDPSRANSAAPNSDGSVSDADGDLRYGLLREVQPDRYLSPAGLMYGPGSQEGHRLKHLERHVRDDPSRPGPHGVFDGGMEGALKVIDRGYEKAKAGQSGVSKEESDGRTVYTVTMGSRIGFVGGRDGNRRNKPMARRLRLVLEGNRVITAFPL